MKFFIRTFGCQMNKLDSDLVNQKLSDSGFREAPTPFLADIVIVNTCAVRKKAEDRAFKYISEWKRRGKTMVALGCVAKLLGKELYEAGADLVFGPRSYRRIDKILIDYFKGDLTSTIFLEGEKAITFTDLSLKRKVRKNEFSAFITIQEGCDKVCTFCVVPKTRGREVSRPPRDLLMEAKTLEKEGILEITLLGQNVNSYFYENIDFADLLRLFDAQTGFKRIRFTTSHPADMNYKILNTIANSARITHWFHLPLQSGSTKVLKEMKRFYTKEEYIELANTIRGVMKDATISTDIMVGFPGETERDFEDTLDVVEKVAFDSAYTFIYSKRPGTQAALRKDQVPLEVAGPRLRTLIELVNKKIYERRTLMLGKTSEILISGTSRKDPNWSTGKTKGNITCVVPGKYPRGTFLKAKIVDIKGLTPVGKPIEAKMLAFSPA